MVPSTPPPAAPDDDGDTSDVEGLIQLNEKLSALNHELSALNAELEQARTLFETAFSAAPSGMLAVDEAGVIVLANKEAHRLFGYDRGALLGEPLKVLLPESARALHPDLRRDYLADPTARRMGSGRDLRGRRRDGSEFPLEIGLNPTRVDAGVLVIATVVDRSEIEAEKARVRAHTEALAASNRELEQFAYVASHDLREPLRMVSSFLGLLDKRYAESLDDRARRYIHFAVDGADRMRHMLDALLEFSRVGRGERAWKQVALTEIAGRAAQLFEAHRDAFVIGDLPTVQGDPLHLERVFQNLFGNAVKFCAERPLRVEVTAERTEDGWVVAVADNGIGFETADAGHIFEMFHRMDPENRDGSGIGLAIVAKIMELHRGSVSAAGVPGGGATFRLQFPIEA